MKTDTGTLEARSPRGPHAARVLDSAARRIPVPMCLSRRDSQEPYRAGSPGAALPRLKEAAKLGFERAVMPKALPSSTGAARKVSTALPITEISNLRDLLALFGLEGGKAARKARAGGPQNGGES